MSGEVQAMSETIDVLVAMVIRAAREVTPRLRANILEELEELVPGSLDGLSVDERPETIRRRLPEERDDEPGENVQETGEDDSGSGADPIGHEGARPRGDADVRGARADLASAERSGEDSEAARARRSREQTTTEDSVRRPLHPRDVTGWCPQCGIGLPRGVLKHEGCPNRIDQSSRIDAALEEVEAEVRRADAKFERYNSAHETYGVLAEELAEFFDEVRKKPFMRGSLAIRGELAQIACVAIRGMASLDEETLKR